MIKYIVIIIKYNKLDKQKKNYIIMNKIYIELMEKKITTQY